MGFDRMERLVRVDADKLLIGHQGRNGMGFQGDRLRLEFGDSQYRIVVVRRIENYAPELGRAVVSMNLGKIYLRMLSFPQGTSV